MVETQLDLVSGNLEGWCEFPDSIFAATKSTNPFPVVPSKPGTAQLHPSGLVHTLPSHNTNKDKTVLLPKIGRSISTKPFRNAGFYLDESNRIRHEIKPSKFPRIHSKRPLQDLVDQANLVSFYAEKTRPLTVIPPLEKVSSTNDHESAGINDWRLFRSKANLQIRRLSQILPHRHVMSLKPETVKPPVFLTERARPKIPDHLLTEHVPMKRNPLVSIFLPPDSYETRKANLERCTRLPESLISKEPRKLEHALDRSRKAMRLLGGTSAPCLSYSSTLSTLNAAQNLKGNDLIRMKTHTSSFHSR